MNEPDDFSTSPFSQNNNNTTTTSNSGGSNNNNNNNTATTNIDIFDSNINNCTSDDVSTEKIRPTSSSWLYSSGANNVNDNCLYKSSISSAPPSNIFDNYDRFDDKNNVNNELETQNNNNIDSDSNDDAGDNENERPAQQTPNSVDNIYNPHPNQSTSNNTDQPSSQPPTNESEHSVFDLTPNTTSFNTSYDDVDYNISNLSITSSTNNDNNPVNSIARKITSNNKKPRRHAWGNLSYAEIISKAISSSPEQRLTLSQIYDWMIKNIPYFASKSCAGSSAGWKNSVRHNLSLHDRFVRIHTPPPNKCSYWTLASLVDTVSLQPRKSTTSIKSNTSKSRPKRARRSVHVTKEPYLSTTSNQMDSLFHNLIPTHQYQMKDTLPNSANNHLGRPVSDSIVVFDGGIPKDIMIGHSPNFINNNSLQFSDNSSLNKQSNSAAHHATSSDYAHNDSVFLQQFQPPSQPWNNPPTRFPPNMIHNPFLNVRPPPPHHVCTSVNESELKTYSHHNMVPSNYLLPHQQYFSSPLGDSNAATSTSMHLIEKSIQMNIPNMNSIEHLFRKQNDNSYNFLEFNQNPPPPPKFHNPIDGSSNFPPPFPNYETCNNNTQQYHRVPNNDYVNYIPNEMIPPNNILAGGGTDDIHSNNQYLMNILNQCKYFGETDNKHQPPPQPLAFQRFVNNLPPSSSARDGGHGSGSGGELVFTSNFFGSTYQPYPNNTLSRNNNTHQMNDKTTQDSSSNNNSNSNKNNF